MKNGRTIEELSAEIIRQAESKKDYMAPTQVSKITVETPSVVDQIMEAVEAPKRSVGFSLPVNGGLTLGITNHGHRQIAEAVGIPFKYYERMLGEAPDLLADNVNHWFSHQPTHQLIRTLDGRVRAFLSNRYRPLDNLDLAEAVLPILINEFNMTIRSSEVTENKFYLKATRPALQAEVKTSRQVGDIVEAGIAITNSETGMGSLSIQPLVFRLSCLNGMIAEDATMTKRHTGSRSSAQDEAREYLRDETRRTMDKAFWMQVQDLTRSALDGAVFQAQVNKISAAAGQVIESLDLIKVSEVTAQKFGLNDNERGMVLKNLLDSGDRSKWGLCNAITLASQSVEDYDRATDLERMGGMVVELPKRDWEDISKAA